MTRQNKVGLVLGGRKVLRNGLLVALLGVGLGLMVSAGQAQTFTVLKSFGLLTNITGFNRARMFETAAEKFLRPPSCFFPHRDTEVVENSIKRIVAFTSR